MPDRITDLTKVDTTKACRLESVPQKVEMQYPKLSGGLSTMPRVLRNGDEFCRIPTRNTDFGKDM